MKTTILIQKVPNPEIMVFHLKKLISEARHETFDRPLRTSSDTHLAKVGKIGAQVIRDLMEIEGVTQVTITPYELMVTKGNAFHWHENDELLLQAVKVLKTMLLQAYEIKEGDIEVIDPHVEKKSAMLKRDKQKGDDTTKSSLK